MRRTILLSLFVLLAASAAKDACAQRRGGGGSGFARGGYNYSRARAVSRYGYAYLPYDSGVPYDYASQPVLYDQPPAQYLQPPPPPVARPVGHPVILEFKWPAAATVSVPSTTPESEAQTFGIVLKNGTTLSAVSVFSSSDGLHYVDPDARHLRVLMSEVDRAATLKLNRARNLDLYLPAAE